MYHDETHAWIMMRHTHTHPYHDETHAWIMTRHTPVSWRDTHLYHDEVLYVRVGGGRPGRHGDRPRPQAKQVGPLNQLTTTETALQTSHMRSAPPQYNVNLERWLRLSNKSPTFGKTNFEINLFSLQNKYLELIWFVIWTMSGGRAGDQTDRQKQIHR